jgi:hypothetical protein
MERRHARISLLGVNVYPVVIQLVVGVVVIQLVVAVTQLVVEVVVIQFGGGSGGDPIGGGG